MNPARMMSTTYPNRSKRGFAAVVCSVALLSACGSDKGSSGAATTPATATTSTAAPQPTTAATEPTVTIATVVSPTDASTESPATEPTPTAGADTTEPTSGSTPSSAASADEFKEVAPPKVPTTSAPIAASGTQPDGVYYATVADNGDPLPADGAVVLEFVQLFRGDDCTAHFGTADTDSCVNDYGVVKDPTAAVEVPLGSQYITVSDAATQKSYQVTGTELYGLLHGDAPAAGAPDGYTYTGFGYVVTVAGGKVTRMEQWWTP